MKGNFDGRTFSCQSQTAAIRLKHGKEQNVETDTRVWSNLHTFRQFTLSHFRGERTDSEFDDMIV